MYAWKKFKRMINNAVYIIVIRNYSHLFWSSVTVYSKDQYISRESYELLGHILASFPSDSNF